MTTRYPTIPIVPTLLLPGVEAAHKVQSRSTSGRFTRLRWLMVWLTQLFFFGLPWLNWHGRQAVRFDLEAKRFYLFKLVMYPQDLIWLTGLLVLSALLLFVVTTVAGRVWCGFACPQTVYTEMFLWVERRLEGERLQRLKLDRSPWAWTKVWRRGGKHLVWVMLSLWTGLSFVGWFSPMRELCLQALGWHMGPWDLFWTGFYGLATYGNAGYLREKVCQHMCPYGRFQGALMDAETLIVSYDAARGEPRGAQRAGGKTSARLQGACIDCTVCVQVCPVGIDIREGMQSACIGCAVCIDACDAVMDKVGAPRGLIRYASLREMGDAKGRATRSTWGRQRVRVYVALLLGLTTLMACSIWLRPDVRVDVIRDRGVMARWVDEGAIENVYRLQLMNQSEVTQHISLAVDGLPGAQLMMSGDGVIEAAQDRLITVAVRLPAQAASRLAGQTLPIRFRVANRSEASAGTVTEGSTFVLPR
jgi:cytochrome c oxidase accessory protein FixG